MPDGGGKGGSGGREERGIRTDSREGGALYPGATERTRFRPAHVEETGPGWTDAKPCWPNRDATRRPRDLWPCRSRRVLSALIAVCFAGPSPPFAHFSPLALSSSSPLALPRSPFCPSSTCATGTSARRQGANTPQRQSSPAQNTSASFCSHLSSRTSSAASYARLVQPGRSRRTGSRMEIRRTTNG